MLTVSGVSAGYGRIPVLHDVGLAVGPGEVVALLGANGAGKTTLLRVASGLMEATQGTVHLDGTDLTGASADACARAGICHVPASRGVFPSLTVRENLELQVDGRDAAPGVALAVEAFPALGNRLGQRAGSMSGGEQQMLALARAYVQQPALMLLDEVSMGLAPMVVDEIFRFLELVAAEGRSLLLVEQYVHRALALADYVFILDRGEIAFAGEPGELADADLFEAYLGGAA
jgi:branched-chain amino acid transport system ATP-binding protein